MRDFNITGLCVPRMHYMADTTAKLDKITEMIDKGLYFTINRARQYGKTTIFNLLGNRLKDRYLVVDISFEGIDDDHFKSKEAFAAMFSRQFADGLNVSGIDDKTIEAWDESAPNDMEQLGRHISAFCNACAKPVVLLIDEVDKSSNNQVFLNFLGMLRDKYLKRNKGVDASFHNVILAGVYDIKIILLRTWRSIAISITWF